MKKIIRRPLDGRSLDELLRQQKRVDAEPDRSARVTKARKLWDSRKRSQGGRVAFAQIEATLGAMCNGPQRCMYCEDSEAADVEHIRPKSGYPEATFIWENYLLSCPICNSYFKRDQYHEGFMDPSRSDYSLWERWIFDPQTGHYFPRHADDEGAARTLEILGFDRRQTLAERRRSHLVTLVVGIREYARARARGHAEKAREIARSFFQLFPALTEWLLTEDPSPELFPEISIVRKVKERFPEILEDARVSR